MPPTSDSNPCRRHASPPPSPLGVDHLGGTLGGRGKKISAFMLVVRGVPWVDGQVSNTPPPPPGKVFRVPKVWVGGSLNSTLLPPPPPHAVANNQFEPVAPRNRR